MSPSPTAIRRASSIQCIGNVAGETIVRYDNFPDHPGASRYHRHQADGEVAAVDFESVRDLYERFKHEVRNHGDEWD